MNKKREKKKEDLRNQIYTKFNEYRNIKGILFFDEVAPQLNIEPYALAENDIEVLLLRLNKSEKILVTTQCLFLINKSRVTKINAVDIEDYNYMTFLNSGSIKDQPILKRIYIRFQLRRHIGDFRIIKKDRTFIDVYISKGHILSCLAGIILKLQFTINKYEGV